MTITGFIDQLGQQGDRAGYRRSNSRDPNTRSAIVLPEPERPLTTISFMDSSGLDHQLVKGFVIFSLAQLATECLVIQFAGDKSQGFEVCFALAFGHQQGEQYIDGLIVDGVESNGLFSECKKYGGEWMTIRDAAVGYGNGATDTRTPHLFPG